MSASRRPFQVVTGDPGPAQRPETWATRLQMLADDYPGAWVDVNSTWQLKLAQHVTTRLKKTLGNVPHVRGEVTTRKVEGGVRTWLRVWPAQGRSR